MIKFDVLKRFSSEIAFTAEIECAEDAPTSIKLGLAVKWAVKARANLADANLVGANLVRAYLAGANLADANLADANLVDANLVGANLVRANLVGAYLVGANLVRANLADANLADAYLVGANLADANLADAYLAGAYLAGANLADANLVDANLVRANLVGAKWRDGITIQKAPIYISGLAPYRVTILDQHMQIGCELHSLADWESFDDRRIIEMDGRSAADFWRANKSGILSIARGAGRSFEPIEQKAEAA